MTTGTRELVPPALALINPAGLVERSTEEFTRRCNGAASLIERDPQIDRVLRGQADRATVTVAGMNLDVEAISSADGVRHALLTARGGGHDEHPADQDGWGERFDDSPALIWLKDLDGKYTRINRRYTELLGTSVERLLGHSDEELPPGEVVDGPRLLSNGGPATEPLQLEYTISPFEHRPALAVLRFPVRGPDGEPVAVCGVAAPLSEARVARSECARLMRLERWSRLDPGDVRHEVIEEWGLIEVVPNASGVEVAADEVLRPAGDAGSDSLEVPAGADLQDAIAQRDHAIEQRDEAIGERDAAVREREALSQESEALQRELGEGRRRIAALHEASATAARRAHELMSALTQEQERTARLEQTLEQAGSGQPSAPEPDQEALREHRERAEQALEELNATREDVARLEAELDQQRAEMMRVGDELARERELAEAARPARAALQEAQAAAAQLQFELQQAHSGLQRARAEAQKSEAAASQARAEAENAGEALEQARGEAAANAEALAQARAEAAGNAQAAEQARGELGSVRERARAGAG